jgi:hypothetical protein
VHRRHEPPGEQERRKNGEDEQCQHDGNRADHLLAEQATLHILGHAEAQVAGRRFQGRSARRRGKIAGMGVRCDSRFRDQGDEFYVVFASDRDVVFGDAHRCRGRLRQFEWRQLLFRKPVTETALDQHIPVDVDHAGIGDVRIVAYAVQHLLEVILVRGRDTVFRELRNDPEHRGALISQLLLVIAPLLREMQHRQCNRREEDESDGEQIELGQQSHPHRRQVKRRRRVALERGQMAAQSAAKFHARARVTDDAISASRSTRVRSEECWLTTSWIDGKGAALLLPDNCRVGTVARAKSGSDITNAQSIRRAVAFPAVSSAEVGIVRMRPDASARVIPP